jgi:hypothetical protein
VPSASTKGSIANIGWHPFWQSARADKKMDYSPSKIAAVRAKASSSSPRFQGEGKMGIDLRQPLRQIETEMDQ